MDEQIREHERTIAKLKRARNSLLNVSRLPPEVLGDIFRWNVILRGNFDGLEERSHNFLLVCHHWLEVASRAPELWSFWGNTPQDWARRYPRSGAGPLDLVLVVGGTRDCDFDATLFDVLRDRASRDSIRRIHFHFHSTADPKLLNDILSSLASKSEGIRSNSVQSIILRNWNWRGSALPVQVSDFFVRYFFPKLRHLDLTHCTISSWDHLKLRTCVLTNLILDPADPSPTLSASQLLSILTSNPSLREISLSGPAIPNDGDDSSFQVPLHHLKELHLNGNTQDVLRLLHRLDHPRIMDHLSLSLDCTITDISQTIGPYLGDHIRRRGKSQGGLGLILFPGDCPELYVGDMDENDHSAAEPQINWFLAVDILPDQAIPQDVTLDLIAHIPLDELVDFRSEREGVYMGSVYARFPNLRTLRFDGTPLATIFPKLNPGGDEGIFLSLQRIFLHQLVVDDGDWSPLTTFLSHRISTGIQLPTLEIFCCPRMDPEMVEVIRAAVQEFKAGQVSLLCHFNHDN